MDCWTKVWSMKDLKNVCRRDVPSGEVGSGVRAVVAEVVRVVPER